MRVDKMKRNIFAITIVGMLLLSSFLSSPVFSVSNRPSVATTNNITEEGASDAPLDGDIVWDNGMNYNGLFAAQWDESILFDAYPADDFQFNEETEINDVCWIGGYWDTNYSQGDFDWNITFYYDGGDGESPGSIYAGPFTYEQDQCNPVEINDSGYDIYYEFSVDLPASLTFAGSEKYWISIWGVGAYPPQSGWGYNMTITMHQAVFKSEFFGYSDWNNTEDALGIAVDMCFQLSHTEQYNNPPDQPSDPNPSDEAEDVDLNPTISVYVSDPDGDTMDVIFYKTTVAQYTPVDEEIGRINDVPSDTRANLLWEELDYNTTYHWYAIANDSEYGKRSDTWNFTTREETPNTPPVANFNYSINDLTVTFDASESYDPDGEIVEYFWDFGDGETGYGVIVEHNYTGGLATYTVELTVTDNGSKTGSISKDIDVINNLPVANFTYVVDGKTVEYDASSSFDENGTIVGYYWDFGDGTNGTGIKTNHEYAEDYKTYTVKLTVNDSAGASSNVSKNITIDDIIKPTVEIVKPIKGLYIRNNFVIPRIRMPLIIGDITIEVNATDENGSGIKQVNFYIDSFRPFGKQEGNATEPNEDGFYTYNWTKKLIFGFRLLHIHTIKVVVEDNAGNIATETMLVRRIL